MLVSIFSAFAATAGKGLLGQIPWAEAGLVVTGSALGTIVGAQLIRYIPGRPLRWLLIGVLILLLARTSLDLFTA
jgi:uncharacterized membrane protein YfcA